MLQTRFNILKALFDIKPVDNTGRIDVGKIAAVSPRIDLSGQGTQRASLREAKMPFVGFGTWDESVGMKDLALINQKPAGNADFGLKPRYAIGSQKSYQKKSVWRSPIAELENYLNSNLNIKKELRSIGGKTVLNNKIGKPRCRPILLRSDLNNEVRPQSKLSTSNVDIINDFASPMDLRSQCAIDDYQTILSQINERILPETDELFIGEPRRIELFEYWDSRPLTTSQVGTTCDVETSDVKASPEIESWVRYAKTQSVKYKMQKIFNKFTLMTSDVGRIIGYLRYPMSIILGRKNLLALGVVSFSALIFTSFGQYGISVKSEILKESNLAVANLEQANENLMVFDFEAASGNFTDAYEEFSKAGDSLNFMGASVTSLFAELPGAGKLKSAKNLVEAGKLLAEAGQSMSEAVSSLAQTSSILKLTALTTSDVGSTSDVQTSIPNIFGNLKKSLVASNRNLFKAKTLLSDVSPDVLPEDKRESFLEFKSKLPELENIVSDAVEYADFLERFLGFRLATSDGRGTSDVRYLVLFQNNSELRPTGGFPGTYAVVTFKNGQLSDFLVDDVYNLDGQLKENIIPPKPLQHITPNWGMRDAGWFIDFSVSAQKAMEFFKKEAGYEVDGVITMSPRIISDILKVVGPIEMPEYGFSLNDENFLSTIQAEVEYGDNREQPKSVVMDMAPRFLERIYSSDQSQWLDVFNVFMSGLDKKDILMYFKDLNLERFAADKGFGGLVKNTDEDYLMVTFTNVKGSKTDKVTDNYISINSKFETLNSKPVIIHKLTITRQHNGGDTKYGFYNRQNPAYVRVLVPEDSKLLSISGNSNPGYKPLLNYSGTDFKQDDNLFQLEDGFHFDSDKGVSTYKESGKTGFAFWLITDPGKRETVELEYVVPLTTSQVGCGQPTCDVQTYGIYIQKQPGLEVDNFEFQVGDTYIYSGEFDKDMELRFKAE